jgi:ferric-dicitrate binding protein FerR (iron transport regulator)
MNEDNSHRESLHDMIVAYLTGNLPNESYDVFINKLDESPEDKKMFNEFQEIWKSLNVVEESNMFDASNAFRLFKGRLNIAGKKQKIRRRLYMVIVFIPFLFLSYFAYKHYSSPSTAEPMLSFSEVTVPHGSKTQIILPDGTKVWINSGSQLRYNDDFGKSKRDVQLFGEAYIEVRHMENCPLIVTSGNINVRVLGTKFNINAYKENDEIKVSLFHGAIEMDINHANPVMLSPEDVAIYSLNSKQMKIMHHATANTLNWMENKLIFEGETFVQIIRSLERNFNVKVFIHTESIKECRFTGDFVKNETIEQIFKVMAANGKFKYKIKGNIIDVY